MKKLSNSAEAAMLLALRRITICVIMLTLAVLPNIASADVTNGGFETGDFTGWSTIGVASIETAAYGAGPTEGSYQALVISEDGSLVSDSTIETFLGLAAGTLDGLIDDDATAGSAIKQTITASAGDMLTFDWNFLTDEMVGTVPDFTFVSIVSGTSEILADVGSSTFVSSATTFSNETGFTMFTYTFPTSGTFTLGFGVMHAWDNEVDSGLLLDNVTIIPEPTTICLLGLGALSLLRRKRSV
jgi:hypothetical protein